MKRVILLIIDALTGPLLVEQMDEGRYPNFQKLKEKGVFREQCVSIFPSITHAALTSLATGDYPAEHGVVGSHWYDIKEEQVVYFSGSFEMIIQKGAGEFLREFLQELNHKHLETPTIFQQLERQGLETVCINFPIYRGDVAHEVNMPLLLKWIPGLPADTTVMGPKKLLLGDLLANPDGLDVEASLNGALQWFGFRDENTIDLMIQLAEKKVYLDFTLAYFPENDKHCHDLGPVEAHKQLSDIDDMLGRMFEGYDGIDSFLEEFALLIVGDHSQSITLPADEEEGIDLEQVLVEYKLAEAGQPWTNEDEIMACPNLRAAHLFLKQVNEQIFNDICQALLADERIDQVIYVADLIEDKNGYNVYTSEGELRFWRSNDGISDRWDNKWQWEGDLTVVSGKVEDELIKFPDYPNAFERLAGVLDSRKSGHLWVTAKLGYEFKVPHVKTNPDGGSHGSLHRLDSQPPLFVAGAPDEVNIPQYPRITDVVSLCCACLQLP